MSCAGCDTVERQSKDTEGGDLRMLTISMIEKMLANLHKPDLELLRAEATKRIQDHVETVGR